MLNLPWLTSTTWVRVTDARRTAGSTTAKAVVAQGLRRHLQRVLETVGAKSTPAAT